jgi:hypothetical protein
MKFARLYLAGSVLPRNYDWKTVIDDRRQVTEIFRSDRGTKDLPVGVLATALERLSGWFPSFRGIGSAGYDGFSYDKYKNYHENTFDGGHSVMFQGKKEFEEEKRISSIVNFLTSHGDEDIPTTSPTSPGWFRFLHKNADYVVLASAGLYVSVLVFLLLAPYLLPHYVSLRTGIALSIVMTAVLSYLLYRF